MPITRDKGTSKVSMKNKKFKDSKFTPRNDSHLIPKFTN